MKVEMYKCNYCHKTVEDQYAEIGWIQIYDGLHFHITNGRKKDGVANTERFYSGTSQLDFCSITCFLQWIYMADDTNNKCEKIKDNEEKSKSDAFFHLIQDEIKIINMT